MSVPPTATDQADPPDDDLGMLAAMRVDGLVDDARWAELRTRHGAGLERAYAEHLAIARSLGSLPHSLGGAHAGSHAGGTLADRILDSLPLEAPAPHHSARSWWPMALTAAGFAVAIGLVLLENPRPLHHSDSPSDWDARVSVVRRVEAQAPLATGAQANADAGASGPAGTLADAGHGANAGMQAPAGLGPPRLNHTVTGETAMTMPTGRPDFDQPAAAAPSSGTGATVADNDERRNRDRSVDLKKLEIQPTYGAGSLRTGAMAASPSPAPAAPGSVAQAAAPAVPPFTAASAPGDKEASNLLVAPSAPRGADALVAQMEPRDGNGPQVEQRLEPAQRADGRPPASAMSNAAPSGTAAPANGPEQLAIGGQPAPATADAAPAPAPAASAASAAEPAAPTPAPAATPATAPEVAALTQPDAQQDQQSPEKDSGGMPAKDRRWNHEAPGDALSPAPAPAPAPETAEAGSTAAGPAAPMAAAPAGPQVAASANKGATAHALSLAVVRIPNGWQATITIMNDGPGPLKLPVGALELVGLDVRLQPCWRAPVQLPSHELNLAAQTGDREPLTLTGALFPPGPVLALELRAGALTSSPVRLRAP